MEEDPVARWLEALGDKYDEGRHAKYEEEKKSCLELYLKTLNSELAETYTLAKPLAVGGTGVVSLGSWPKAKA